MEASHGRPSDSWLHSSSHATTSRPAASYRPGLVRSSSQDDAESSASSGYATADRAVTRRGTSSGGSASSAAAASNRGSFYASGTQSAYGSRDASPETSGRGDGPRRITAYPAAPPSMIITPSHTPRRAASVEPDAGDTPLTSADILRLYEKLNAIERETEKDITLATATAMLASSAADRRTRPMAKSASAAAGGTDTNGEDSRTSATVAPAGGTAAGKLTTSARSASVSPRSARRQFYDEYPYEPSKRGAAADAGGRTPGESSRGPGCPDQSHAPRSASVTRDDPLKSRISSAATSFFQSIKDRRKLFGAKKSSSVDTPTQSSIARIGANVLTEPAAPSTYQPPAIPEPQPTSSGRGRTLGKLHRRTGSVDMVSASADSHSAATSSQQQAERSSSVTREGRHDLALYFRISVGDKGQGARAPLKVGKNIFGQLLCKIRTFIGQKSCKIREFCKIFGQIS